MLDAVIMMLISSITTLLPSLRSRKEGKKGCNTMTVPACLPASPNCLIGLSRSRLPQQLWHGLDLLRQASGPGAVRFPHHP